MEDRQASIGLRARTGRAIAVVLVGSPDAPAVWERREISVIDPRRPGSYQPYHEVMELPWAKAQVAVRKLARVVEQMATKALAQLINDLLAQDYRVNHIGIVGAPERALEKIGSPHIRAHAAEGVLFRHVLELAAENNGVPYRTFAEQKLNALAAAELRIPIVDLERRLIDLGRAIGRPWRADEKAAAASAWLAFGSRQKAKAKTERTRRRQ
jgi:hypothetical protein